MVDKLITALRTAVEKGNGSLEKEATSHDDCFDAFRWEFNQSMAELAETTRELNRLADRGKIN